MDHWQIIDASGALDLTFARSNRGGRVANVKSAPLVLRMTDMRPGRLLRGALQDHNANTLSIRAHIPLLQWRESSVIPLGR
jgi:hypothetical protein